MTINNEKKLKVLQENYTKIYLEYGQSVHKFTKLPLDTECDDSKKLLVSLSSLLKPERFLQPCGYWTSTSVFLQTEFSDEYYPNYFLLTAKTDNQNAELSKLTEQNPAYIFQVSGRHCNIVTSIYQEFYVSFYSLLTRLTYTLLTEINTNSLFMIVFNQLNEDYVTTATTTADGNTTPEAKAMLLQKAFYDILGKCINIYLITKT